MQFFVERIHIGDDPRVGDVKLAARQGFVQEPCSAGERPRRLIPYPFGEFINVNGPEKRKKYSHVESFVSEREFEMPDGSVFREIARRKIFKSRCYVFDGASGAPFL